MAALVFTKPASPARNVWTSFTHKALALWAVTEGSGLSVANYAPARSILAGAATLVDGGLLAWQTDANDDPYVAFSGAGDYGVLFDNSGGGSAVAIPRGHLDLEFCVLEGVEAGARPILRSSATITTASTIALYVPASADEIQLRINGADASQHTYSWTTGLLSGTRLKLQVEWGSRNGFKAWLNGVAGTVVAGDPAALTTGWEIPAGEKLWLSHNGGTGYGRIGWWAGGIYAKPFCARERIETRFDLQYPVRPPSDLWALDTTGVCCIPTDTSATFNLVAKSDLVGDAYFRVHYSADPTFATYDTLTLETPATAGLPGRLTATWLTTGTRYYWVIDESADGETWTPHSMGIAEFVCGDDGHLAFLADDHASKDKLDGVYDCGYGDDILYEDDGTPRAAGNAQVLFALWKALEHLYCSDTRPTGIVHQGDNVYAEDAAEPTIAAMFPIFAREARLLTLAFKSGWFVNHAGNHGMVNGYHQCDSNGDGWQMPAQILYWRFFPNPEGPTLSLDEWVAAADQVAEGYLAAYVQDEGGENRPYGIFDLRVGDVHLFFGHRGLSADLGSRTWPALRASNVWKFGTEQYAWLASGLANSDAPFKLLTTHEAYGDWAHGQLTGVECGPYGHASNVHIGNRAYWNQIVAGTLFAASEGVDEQPQATVFKALLRQTGAVGELNGHHHIGCDVLRDTVSWLSVPTLAAGLQSQQGGWHTDEINASFGLANTGGSELAALGLLGRWNVLGYCTLSVSGGVATWSIIQTCCGVLTDLISPMDYLERRMFGDALTPVGDQLTIADLPEWGHVVRVTKASMLLDEFGEPVEDWWGIGLENIITPAEACPYQPSTTVTLDEAPGEDVYVAYAPRVLYSRELSAATRPTGMKSWWGRWQP